MSILKKKINFDTFQNVIFRKKIFAAIIHLCIYFRKVTMTRRSTRLSTIPKATPYYVHEPKIEKTKEPLKIQQKYVCNCGDSFKRKFNLQVHIFKVHRKAFSCDKCESSFQEKIHLERGHRKIKSLSCFDCDPLLMHKSICNHNYRFLYDWMEDLKNCPMLSCHYNRVLNN